MISQELFDKYNKIFSEDDLFIEIAAKIDKMKDDPDQQGYREVFCDNLLSNLSTGFYKYGKSDLAKEPLYQCYCKECNLLENDYYKAVGFFFSGKNEKCIEYLKKSVKQIFSSEKLKMNEAEFASYFVTPFKDAFPGFWDKVSGMLCNVGCEKGIPELCHAVNLCYTSSDNEEIINGLAEALMENPDSVVVKELLGYTYYSMQMWGNAIAYFEQIETPFIFFMDNILFFLAWSYGKQRNTVKEIEYYELCLKSWDESPDAKNNLGYAYYKKHDYQKALRIFDECIKEKRDFPYSVNNYARTLLALGRNKDAKEFAVTPPCKISKTILDRIKKADSTNAHFSKKEVTEISIETENDSDAEVEKVIDFGIKKQQFSNEKLLEDELTLRIESGMNVFGLPLKIYRRKGIYGRQYIIPIGRLDLLAEDTDGNLYVIELKKDSGYDDAYVQTAAYIDWFEKNKISAGKKVYGIICLNNPSKKLVEDVRKDDRIKLYEYQISYSEIK